MRDAGSSLHVNGGRSSQAFARLAMARLHMLTNERELRHRGSIAGVIVPTTRPGVRWAVGMVSRPLEVGAIRMAMSPAPVI